MAAPKTTAPRGGVPRGLWGEDAAAAHAEARGARVLARNVRDRQGEVDLVLADGPVIAFAEVKARRNRRLGGGREAVGWRKQQKVARAALGWLVRCGVDPSSVRCRFDVFEVAPGPEVTWLKDAFRVDLG